MLSPATFKYSLYQVKKEASDLLTKINKLEEETQQFLDRSDRAEVKRISVLEKQLEHLQQRYDSAKGRHQKQLEVLNQEIQKLKAQLNTQDSTDSLPKVLLDKARTIAIFDAILHGIVTWSKDGDLANDVEMACQSFLFPAVYEKVMRGTDPAYLLDDVPFSASIVVQRGREITRWIREECETTITEPTAWKQYSVELVKWLRDDALALIYGEADDAWQTVVPYSLDQMLVWKNNPADRMMEFPEVYDAMDLVRRTRTEVIPGTQIAKFNTQVASTRL